MFSKKFGCFFILLLLTMFLLPAITSAVVWVENSVVKENLPSHCYQESYFGRKGQTLSYFRDPVWKETLTAMFKEYGFNTFRFHFPNYQHWKYPVSEWGPLAGITDIMTESEFLAWIKENDFRAIIQVNNFNYYDPNFSAIYDLEDSPGFITAAAQEQADLVTWVNNNGYSSYIYYWELGNENYHSQYPETCADISKEFIIAMKAADPSIKLCIVGQSTDWTYEVTHNGETMTVGEWTTRYLTRLRDIGVDPNDIDYVAHHAYANDSPPLATGTRSSAADIPPVANDWSYYSQPTRSQTGSIGALVNSLNSLGYSNTMIEVNEFKRGGYNSYYSRSWMNALANSDPLLYFIKTPRVSGALIWDSVNGGGVYSWPDPWSGEQGLGIFIRDTQRFYATPTAEMCKLVVQMLSGAESVVASYGTATYSAAVLGQNKLKFIIVNKDSSDYTETINLNGYNICPGTFTASVYSLQSDDRGAFTINPSTGVFTDISITQLPEVYFEENSFDHLIKKYSLTLFEIDLRGEGGFLFEYLDSPLNHGWQVYDGSGSVNTVYDSEKGSRVMETTTAGGTGFGIKYDKACFSLTERYLAFDIKDSDEFRFYVLVRASDGQDYYLTYIAQEGANGVNGNYVEYYLGTQCRDGTWHTIRRDLEEDLNSATGLHLSYVTTSPFWIRGDYRIDNIRWGNSPLWSESEFLAPSGWMLFSSGSAAELLWQEDPLQHPGVPGWKATDGSSTYPIKEAAAAGWLQGTIYYFDNENEVYKITPGDDEYVRNSCGYWLWSNLANLILTRP